MKNSIKNHESKNSPRYKDKSLVRCGDILYYGNMCEPVVVKIEIKKKKIFKGSDIAQNLSIKLISTKPNLNPNKIILKTAERESLYSALDLAEFWVEKELENYYKSTTEKES